MPFRQRHAWLQTKVPMARTGRCGVLLWVNKIDEIPFELEFPYLREEVNPNSQEIFNAMHQIALRYLFLFFIISSVIVRCGRLNKLTASVFVYNMYFALREKTERTQISRKPLRFLFNNGHTLWYFFPPA